MGTTAIVKRPLVTNQTFIGLHPRSDALSSEFLYYALQAHKPVLDAQATGAIQTYLSREDFSSLRIAIPPRLQQDAIADYLDRETARIDALIEKKRRIASLLGDRFDSLLDDCTAVGPDRVPVRRLISSITTGSRDWSDRVGDGDGYFVRSMNLPRSGTALDLSSDSMARISAPSNAEAARSRLQAGDILVGVTGANTGWVGYWDGSLSPAFVSQHVAALRPAPEVSGAWLAFALASRAVRGQIAATQYGGTKEGLGLDDLMGLQVRRLSPREQQEQATQLQLCQVETRLASMYVGRQLGLLSELRQALINAGVNGQIPIPGAA